MKLWQGALATALSVCVITPVFAWNDQVNETQFKIEAGDSSASTSSTGTTSTGETSTSESSTSSTAPKVVVTKSFTVKDTVTAANNTPTCKFGYFWDATTKQCISNPLEHFRTCKVNEYSDSNDPEICILKGTGYSGQCNGKNGVLANSCWNGKTCETDVPFLSVFIPVICPKLLKKVTSSTSICTYGYKFDSTTNKCEKDPKQTAISCPKCQIQSSVTGQCVSVTDAGNHFCGTGTYWNGTECVTGTCS
jgi:hypothetical protein